MMDNNLKAFLTLIRTGEGTLGEDGYRTLFGGSKFDSFVDHPRKAIKSGTLTSTAAGAYQILQGTWDSLRKQHIDLVDFSPSCQDKAAIYLIAGRNALDDVLAGRFKIAIIKCNKEWASLPGAPYGQPTIIWSKAFDILRNSGATVPDIPVTEESYPQEKPMLPFLAAAIPSLISAIPEFAKTFSNPDVASRNVEAVSKAADIIMQATQSTNIQAAVDKVQADPAAAQAADDALRASRAEIMDMMERINAIDQSNIKSAREFNAADTGVVGKFKFVHLLSALLVLYTGSFAWAKFDKLDPNMQAMVMTAIIIGGFTAVVGYWLGSSSGSDRKTDIMTKK